MSAGQIAGRCHLIHSQHVPVPVVKLSQQPDIWAQAAPKQPTHACCVASRTMTQWKARRSNQHSVSAACHLKTSASAPQKVLLRLTT